MKRLLLVAFALLLAAPRIHADSGVLIPHDKQQPDSSVLSLEEMNVTVTIDNGDARVYITQIFANTLTGSKRAATSSRCLRAVPFPTSPCGTARCAFPPSSWNAGAPRRSTIRPACRRSIRLCSKPGERDGSDPKATSVFSAKIVPIPAYGTKRLELEYHQTPPTSRFQQTFTLPLRPTAYQKQTAKRFTLRFELHSATPLQDLQLLAKTLPLKFTQQDAHTAIGTFEAANLDLTEDFTAQWKLDAAAANTLTVSTYRNPHPALPAAGEKAPAAAPAAGAWLRSRAGIDWRS